MGVPRKLSTTNAGTGEYERGGGPEPYQTNKPDTRRKRNPCNVQKVHAREWGEGGSGPRAAYTTVHPMMVMYERWTGGQEGREEARGGCSRRVASAAAYAGAPIELVLRRVDAGGSIPRG